jgi:hypothetical protein
MQSSSPWWRVTSSCATAQRQQPCAELEPAQQQEPEQRQQPHLRQQQQQQQRQRQQREGQANVAGAVRVWPMRLLQVEAWRSGESTLLMCVCVCVCVHSSSAQLFSVFFTLH